MSITRRSVEKHAGNADDFWVAFWSAADVVGQHWVWRAYPRIAVGKVVVHPRRLAWLYDGQADAELQASCGNKACIRPSHQRAR